MVSIAGGEVVWGFSNYRKPVGYIWVKAECFLKEMLRAIAVVCSKKRTGLRDEDI